MADIFIAPALRLSATQRRTGWVRRTGNPLLLELIPSTFAELVTAATHGQQTLALSVIWRLGCVHVRRNRDPIF